MFVTEFGRFQKEETCASMVGGFEVLFGCYSVTVDFATAATQISA
jgi:hypothetical protein